MTFIPDALDQLTRDAVAHYWVTLDDQGTRQREEDADRGGRADVLGGKQMDGFCRIVEQLLHNLGINQDSIFYNKKLELPGFFRPTKKWDMLVVHDGNLLAAIEFKSQKGPSFGNNYNNRTEEALGSSHDLWTAYREGALVRSIRPWLGWLMLLEDCRKTTTPVRVNQPHFPIFEEFRGASYAARYELLIRKMMREKMYDSGVLLLSPSQNGPQGDYREPAADLVMRQFLASLGGHITAYQASR